MPTRHVLATITIATCLVATLDASGEPVDQHTPPPPPPSAIGYAQQPPANTSPWLQPAQPAESAPQEAPADKQTFALDIAAAADVPVMIGGQVQLEVPYRFQFQLEAGVMPSFFVDAIDGVLVAAGAYDHTTSDLIRGSLKNSFVLRASGGWRPFPDHGFEILGGYTLTTLGGSVDARTAVEAITNVTIPPVIPDMEVGLSSTIHSVHVALGWRWVVANHFLVRTSIGYLQSVASSSHVTVPDDVAARPEVAPLVEQANRIVDETLDDHYKTYAKLPVFSLALGYRF